MIYVKSVPAQGKHTQELVLLQVAEPIRHIPLRRLQKKHVVKRHHPTMILRQEPRGTKDRVAWLAGVS